MKKILVLASMMMVLSLSAQEKPQGQKSGEKKEQRQRPSTDEQLKKFDQYNLSSSQKEKVKSLLETRNSEKKNSLDKGEKSKGNKADFDAKLEQILDKKQYAQYKQDREERMKSKKNDSKNGKYSNDDKRTKSTKA